MYCAVLLGSLKRSFDSVMTGGLSLKSLFARFKRKQLGQKSKKRNKSETTLIDEFAELHMHPDGMEPYEPISGHMGQIVDSYHMRKYFDRAFNAERD